MPLLGREEIEGFGGIDDGIPLHFGEGGELVGVGAGGGHDVGDGDAAGGEGVGDEGSVAAPGDGFGAHDGEAAGACKLDEFQEIAFEVGGLHVVGIAAEAKIAPGGVGGIFARVAETAESGHVEVFDTGIGEGLWKILLIELGVMPRFRDGADVDEEVDAVGLEEG